MITYRFLFALLIAVGLVGARLSPYHGIGHGGGAPPSTGSIALTRTFNNPTGSSTGSTAFWMAGHPFQNTYSGAAADEVPSGSIVTATLGGTSVPMSCAERKYAADGSLEWCQLLVDFSGVSIAAGGSATLTLTATSGTWCDAQGANTCPSGLTDSGWDALGDVLTLSNFSNAASSVSKAVQGSGTWNAKFDGGVDDQPATVIADTPQGREVKVVGYLWDTTAVTPTSQSYSGTTLTLGFASINLNSNDGIIVNATTPAVCSAVNGNPIAVNTQGAATSLTCTLASNPGTVSSFSIINRNMQVAMYYWQTCKAVGTTCTAAGPVESWGPYIENILLYPGGSANNSTLTGYTFDLSYTRNGLNVRSCSGTGANNGYCGVALGANSIANVLRPDAQGDWTASDPGIYVTQSYASVVNTRKVPPFVKNVSYTGGAISTNTPILSFSGNIFTAQHPPGLTGLLAGASASFAVVPADFKAIGSLTGVGACASNYSCPIYWAVYSGTGTGYTFCFYDTQAHAYASTSGHGTASSCTGTGIITPGGSIGSGVTVENAAAPAGIAQITYSIGAAGSRPDISLMTEWGTAFLVGGDTANSSAQLWQRLGRITANSWPYYLIFAIDASTGRIMCLLDAPGTSGSGDAGCPATSGALGTAYTNDFFYSSDINNGQPPSNPTLVWTGGTDPEHFPNPMFIPWLLEGTPFLQDMLMFQGAGEIMVSGNTARKPQVLTSGSTYYGVTMTNGGSSIRANAWQLRDIAEAAMAAPNGSREETYFRNVLASDMAFAAAYESWEGTNFNNIGLWVVTQSRQSGHAFNASDTIVFNQEVETFEESYMSAALPWIELLQGDYVTGIAAQASFNSAYLNSIYGTGGCPYYGTAYVFDPGLDSWGASPPGAWAASWADVGFTMSSAYTSFVSGNATETVNGFSSAGVAAGDKFRIANFDTGGNNENITAAPPTQFTMGQDYFVLSPNSGAKTIQLSATSGGSAITPTIPAWTASQNLSANSNYGYLIQPNTSPNNPSNHQFFINVPGTTGSTEPNWSAFYNNADGANIDGTAHWLDAVAAQGLVPNGAWIPVVTTCPPGTAGGGGTASPDSYLTYQTAAMALMAEVGVANMSTAWTNGTNLYTSMPYATEMHWLMAPP